MFPAFIFIPCLGKGNSRDRLHPKKAEGPLTRAAPRTEREFLPFYRPAKQPQGTGRAGGWIKDGLRALFLRRPEMQEKDDGKWHISSHSCEERLERPEKQWLLRNPTELKGFPKGEQGCHTGGVRETELTPCWIFETSLIWPYFSIFIPESILLSLKNTNSYGHE